MSSSGYIAWAVTAGEVPTTAYWNILGYNDASFNTGNGFNDGIIIPRHMGLTKTGPDSQGWIKRDYGNWQTYEQTFSVSASVGSGGLINVSNPGMPDGIANSSLLRVWCGSLKGYAGRVTADIDNGNTLLNQTSYSIYVYNNTGGTIAFSGYIYVFAITV